MPSPRYNLFDMEKTRKPELYQFIRLIAPSLEQKRWTSSDAIGAYCTLCQVRLRYKKGDTKQIKRHMENKHQDKLDAYRYMTEVEDLPLTSSSYNLNVNPPNPALNLFEMPNTRKPEFYQFIRLIAPTNEEKKWTSNDAIGAYCTKCNITLRYKSGDTKQISRHMARKHPNCLKNVDRNQMKLQAKARHENMKITKEYVKPSLAEDQATFEYLCGMWTAKSLLPPSIIQDPYFFKIVDFLGQIKTQVQVPTTATNRMHVTHLCSIVRSKMRNLIAENMKDFSASYEVWESPARIVSISTTVHFITPDFNAVSLRLGIVPLPSKFSSQQVSDTITKVFQHWAVDSTNLFFVSRPIDQPVIDMCNSTGVQTLTNLAITMQLIIGAFIDFPDSAESGHTKWIGERDILLAGLTMDERYRNLCSKPFSRSSQEIVHKFRQLAILFSTSTEIANRLVLLDYSSSQKHMRLECNFPTRWTSVYLMLRDILKMKKLVTQFFEYCSTTEGKLEFGDLAIHHLHISEADWQFARGLSQLFEAFYTVIELLGGEKQPTLAIACPVLRVLQQQLNAGLFFGEDMRLGIDSAAMSSLEEIRECIMKEFNYRFEELFSRLLWITILDPRCKQLNHLDEKTKAAAVDQLVGLCLEEEEKQHVGACKRRFSSSALGSSSSEATYGDADTRASLEPPRTHSFKAIKEEVAAFMNLDALSEHIDPFEWWASERCRFPRIARVARKWLGIMVSSTFDESSFRTSHRMFEEQATENPFFKDQLLLHANAESVGLSLTDFNYADAAV